MSAPSKGWDASMSKLSSTPIKKVVYAKLYTMKTLLTTAELLNDQVLAFFEEHAVGLLRVLTDSGPLYRDRETVVVRSAKKGGGLNAR